MSILNLTQNVYCAMDRKRKEEKSHEKDSFGRESETNLNLKT